VLVVLDTSEGWGRSVGILGGARTGSRSLRSSGRNQSPLLLICYWLLSLVVVNLAEVVRRVVNQ